jgi:V/A-type H+-transporting ATPase subunit I
LPTVPGTAWALLMIMSVCTIGWGVMTGVYFGVMLNWSPLRLLRVEWLTNEDNVKLLCFIIGVAHLSLAHLWNIWRMRRTWQAVAQFGWLCTTWTMFFYACKMVLGFAFPSVMAPVFVVGVVCIVLFMTPVKSLKEEWFNHAMLPLNLVSNFVDVVSYIRLFAVGTASYAVASNFNTLLGGMFDTWYTGLFAAVFLFVAHALNIALALMGVMVHGVRLNTLEFSGHVGLQWTGVPYQPFQKICSGTENNGVARN